MDKYLHVETVPKTPRWRNVVRTLDFVLKHTSEQSPHYQSVNASLKLTHLSALSPK
ncbi:hypothetical protein [Salinivibrio kushneri]|uniref:hypothetical protein n=1 Tax=Salinivibrio kushneri TaxID=1908198 RepID=UPI00130104EE|nr:hypothetical protein [Salinivibrio kushneri]